MQTPTKEMLAAYRMMIQRKVRFQQPDVHATAMASLAEIVGQYYYDQRYDMDTVFRIVIHRDILVSIRAYRNLGHPSYLALRNITKPRTISRHIGEQLWSLQWTVLGELIKALTEIQ